MGLHDRIKGPANGTAQLQPDGGLTVVEAPVRAADGPRSVRRAEDAHPPRVHLEARAAALHDADDGRAGRAGHTRGHRGARRSTGRPSRREERRELVRRDHRRHPRLRAARAVPPRRHDHRGHGQRRRPDLRRARAARSSARASTLRRRRAPAADHRQDRLAGRPPRRRGLADGRRAPPRRQPRQRDHPAARRSGARRSRSGSSRATRTRSTTSITFGVADAEVRRSSSPRACAASSTS